MKTVMFAMLLITFLFLSCSEKENKDMNFFSRLFGKKETPKTVDSHTIKFDSTNLESTSEMLDEDLYWDIIEQSKKNSSNQTQQEQFLIKKLLELTPKQIIGFRLRTDKLLTDSYTSDLWCAAYIINGGCSDDGFEYFRLWLISRGKEAFFNGVKNPERIIDEIGVQLEEFEFESFWYVSLNAFSSKTGKQLYDYISDDFEFGEGKYPNFEFTWQENNLPSMKRICPKLYSKFIN